MGCDIHFFVERRLEGVWVSADKWTEDEYEDQPTLVVAYEDRFYRGRSYDLFSILAGVRNGVGFAGSKTGDGYVPISLPRGLPDDVTGQVSAQAAGWGEDGHSHSWLSLRDLLTFDWTQTSRKSGVVTPCEWATFATKGEPEEWSSDVTGGDTRHLPQAEFGVAWETLRKERGWPHQREPRTHLTQHDEDAHHRARFVELLGGGSPYCRVEWEVPYFRYADTFWSTTMPQLLALGAPEDVRIVFWFDN